MSTHPSKPVQPLSPFDKFYANPSPLRALDLAIADAYASRMPGEYFDQLSALRGTVAALREHLKSLSDFTEVMLQDETNLLIFSVSAGLERRTLAARALLNRID